MDFYIYVETSLAALPTSIVCIWYNPEILEEWRERHPNITASEGQNRKIVGKRLDIEEERGNIVYAHEYISPSTINYLGFEKAVSPYLETVIPKLILKLKKNPENIYRHIGCPPSLYYKVQIIPSDKVLGFWLGKMIAYFKRIWYIENIADRKYPEFEWRENQGEITKDHALICLRKGVSYEYHYKDFIKELPRYYLNELKEFNPEFYYCKVVERLPIWWRRTFNCRFTAFFSKEEERDYKLIIDSLNVISKDCREEGNRGSCEAGISILKRHRPVYLGKIDQLTDYEDKQFLMHTNILDKVKKIDYSHDLF